MGTNFWPPCIIPLYDFTLLHFYPESKLSEILNSKQKHQHLIRGAELSKTARPRLPPYLQTCVLTVVVALRQFASLSEKALLYRTCPLFMMVILSAVFSTLVIVLDQLERFKNLICRTHFDIKKQI